MYLPNKIRTPKTDTVHTRWIAAAFDGKEYKLRKWIMQNGNEARIVEYKGCLPSTFWAHLKQASMSDNGFWVCAFKIYELLCWARVYDRIMSGDITIVHENFDKQTGEIEQDSKRLLGALICENPPTIIDARFTNGKRIAFLDIRNWGIKQHHIADTDGEDCIDTTVQAIQDYCCLVRGLNMGMTKQTAAAQGYYCYRRHHMPYELTPTKDEDARALERRSYFGGRCEAYKLGTLEQKIYHVDVTSMYSSIGASERFPVRLADRFVKPDLKLLRWIGPNLHGIADVTISTNNPWFPVRYEKRVIYPIGQFRTVLTYPELIFAWQRGIILELHELNVYDTQPIFTKWSRWYADARIQLKLLGLQHLMPCLKQIVNATYGKFGQRYKQWVDLPYVVPRYSWEQWYQRHPEHNNPVQYRAINGLVQYLDASIEPPMSMPFISATMCAYGRMKLLHAMIIAGKGNTFYVDTDGLMVSQEGFDNLVTAGMVKENDMGFLRIREQANKVEIFGLKHYLFGERYCYSGVPDNFILNKDRQVEFDRHDLFSGGLWHRKAFHPGFHRVIIKRKERYLHGYVNKDKNVSPLQMVSHINPDNGEISYAIAR